MVNTIIYGLLAALGAQAVIASPIAEADKRPATYHPQKPAPKPKAPVCKNRNQVVASFEDLNGIPGTITNDIPTPYRGLDYVGFSFTQVLATGTGLQPGLRPSSGTRYAAANVLSQLEGTSTLTAIYPGSTIDSFTLQSFNFGCAVQLANGAAALPSACNIQITGYRGSDNSVANAKQVCSQQFSYRPTTALATVNLAQSGPVNKDCTNLDFAVVTFSLEGGSTLLSPLAAVVFDDIRYTTCSK